MAIFQRKSDGAWMVSFRDKETKKNRQKYCGVGAKGLKKAEKFNESLNLNPYEKKKTARGPLFVELVREYLDAKAGQSAATTIENQSLKFDSVICPEIGAIEAAKIDKSINAYVKTRQKKGVKMATIHREIDDIRAVLSWSANPSQGYIGFNPLERYRKPSAKTDNDHALKSIIQPPTIDEVRRILAACPDHIRRALKIAFYTGVRPGRSELLNLKWEAVDFDLKRIFVVSAKKNGPAFRYVPLTDGFLNDLKRWEAADRKAANAAKRKPPEHIIHWKFKPVKRIIKGFNAAKTRAGITRRLRPYDFRHSFATLILESGGDLKSTSEMLGHSRVDTTMHHYQQTNARMHRASVQVLAEIDLSLQNVVTENEAETV